MIAPPRPLAVPSTRQEAPDATPMPLGTPCGAPGPLGVGRRPPSLGRRAMCHAPLLACPSTPRAPPTAVRLHPCLLRRHPAPLQHGCRLHGLPRALTMVACESSLPGDVKRPSGARSGDFRGTFAPAGPRQMPSPVETRTEQVLLIEKLHLADPPDARKCCTGPRLRSPATCHVRCFEEGRLAGRPAAADCG